MIKAIFFDFDGVIVESLDIKTQAFAELFKEEGEQIVRTVVDYHLQNAGVSRYDKCRHIYSDMLKRELTEDGLNQLCQRFSKLVTEAVIKAAYVKGANEFLQNHARKYKCFIVSATPQAEIEQILKQREIMNYFSGVYGSPKPKSKSVRDVLDEFSLSAKDSVYIGDAMSDLRAARDNSVNFIARIVNNHGLFDDANCLKVKDLSNLESLLKDIKSEN